VEKETENAQKRDVEDDTQEDQTKTPVIDQASSVDEALDFDAVMAVGGLSSDGKIAAVNKPVDADKTSIKPRKKKHGLKRIGLFILFLLIAALVFTAGNLSMYYGFVDIGNQFSLKNPISIGTSSPEDRVTTRQLAIRLEEVARYLDAESLYRYTQGDLDAATTAAINALLETSGDRYAFYYEPEEYQAYQQSSEGEYAGIGIVLSLKNDEVTVVQVYEDSPASKAGVKAGDVIVAIDGVRKDWTLEDATTTIRRPSGEKVSILWRRGDIERETQMTVQSVSIPTVISQMIEYEGQKVGYIYLRRFSSQSSKDLSEALKKLEAAGAQSFILDLRGNPGGYLNQAIEVTSLFVRDGVVVQIEDRKGTKSRSVNGKPVTDLPLVILINEGSASASELVSAALQDHGRATIVGVQSFGKGTVQDIVQLSWGGAIRYTIAHYMSPNGRTIDGIGVIPDVIVVYTSDIEVIGIEDMITGDNYQYRPNVDSQLDAALRVLREQALRG